MKTFQKYRAFTLLEVLVAISIFSIIGLGAYSLLASVIGTKETIDEQGAELAKLQLMFSLIQQDVSQMRTKSAAEIESRAGNKGRDFDVTDRGERAQVSEVEESSRVDNTEVTMPAIKSDVFSIAFIKEISPNPFFATSQNLERISYSLQTGIDEDSRTQLIRKVSLTLALDNDGAEQADLTMNNSAADITQLLSENILEFNFRFMDGDKNWYRQWPVEKDNQMNVLAEEESMKFSLPLAIELLVLHARLGEIRKIFDIPQGFPE